MSYIHLSKQSADYEGDFTVNPRALSQKGNDASGNTGQRDRMGGVEASDWCNGGNNAYIQGAAPLQLPSEALLDNVNADGIKKMIK